jgi:hypothetical protein
MVKYLQPEYKFDYRQARPNRFAKQNQANSLIVLLDPDVAQIFTSAEAVNAVLRALIQTMPNIAIPTKVDHQAVAE